MPRLFRQKQAARVTGSLRSWQVFSTIGGRALAGCLTTALVVLPIEYQTALRSLLMLLPSRRF